MSTEKGRPEFFLFDEFKEKAGYLPKDISFREFRMFANYIEDHFGITIGDDKFDTLRISLHARGTRLGVKSYDEYFEIIKESDAELKELLSLITVNETYFFRYPEQFHVLGNIILPELILAGRSARNQPLRIWSAGCSTGEEAFSIAITVVESVPDWRERDIKILGTDVSKKALDAAYRGVYPKSAFRITREEILNKYFKKVDDEHFEVIEDLRNLVGFMYHNLIKDPYPFAFIGAWDVIFCRNVTIYFRPESTQKVIKNFYRSIRDGGYLFIGHSETLYKVNPGFIPVRYGDVFVYKKPRAKSEEDRNFMTNYSKNWEHNAALNESPIPEVNVEHIPAASCDLNEIKSESELKSLCSDARIKKILSLLEKDRVADANVEVKALLSTEPLNPEAYHLSGIINKKMGFIEDALEAFRKAIYLDRDFAPSYIEIGSIYYSAGNLEQSIKYYRRAAETLNKSGGRRFLDHKGGELNKFLKGVCKEMIKKISKEMGLKAKD